MVDPIDQFLEINRGRGEARAFMIMMMGGSHYTFLIGDTLPTEEEIKTYGEISNLIPDPTNHEQMWVGLFSRS